MSATSLLSSAPAAPHSSPARRLSILTWNVWFERVEYDARVTEIFRQCSDLRPDVIAFQEVLPEFVHSLRKEHWASEYMASDTDGSTVRPYGVLMLSRLPAEMAVTGMPSRMGRSLLSADVAAGEGAGSVRVATVHLESLNNPQYREQQLLVAANALKQSETSVLVGDFNFCSERSWAEGRVLGREGRTDDAELENAVLKRVLPDHVDVWPALHPGHKGYTFDSTRNGVIRQYEQMRYDRVVAKLGEGWRPASIEMVGTEPIEGRERWLRPSDHFGLLFTMVFEGAGQGAQGGGGCASATGPRSEPQP